MSLPMPLAWRWCQLSLSPAVPADGAVMTLRNVPFTVALGADTMESVVAPGAIYNFSLQLIEAF
jgi:hypothetical protein